MKKIIVVKNPAKWDIDIDDVDVISSREYLTNPKFLREKNLRIFNLSDQYKYQSRGYYVSLLAEARGHKPLPDVKNIIDIKTPKLVKVISEDLDQLIQSSLRRIKSKEFILSVYFGKNIARQYDKLSSELHRLFQAPFIRSRFTHSNNKWILNGVKTISMAEIPEEHLPYVKQYANEYFSKKRYTKPRAQKSIYDLAILVDPEEKNPPSNKQALEKFLEAAEDLGFNAEIIQNRDFNRLMTFDALFIRETTNVNNITYHFSRTAQSEGLAVIDSPDSILKCSNKVFLCEILHTENIPTPKTLIVYSENKYTAAEELGLPCVIKLPDSSFSKGVRKVETIEEYKTEINKIFEYSDMAIVQKYIYSDFDWRIGVLDGRALFACKYFMAKGHWQIYNWNSKLKRDIEGECECVAVEKVPTNIIEIALKSTSIIGTGLYGVDIKEIDGKPYIIEINDNPNIDYGVEDEILKDQLYIEVISSIKKRIEDLRGFSNREN